MKLPILLAWLSLFLSLNYIQAQGWADTSRERGWDWYYGYADNLVKEGKYQDCTPQPDSIHCAEELPTRAYRLPGYPLLLAGIIWIAPDTAPQMVKALQAVLFALIVFMAVDTTQRLLNHRLAAIFGLAVCFSSLVYWVPVAFTEILFAFVLMCFAQVFIRRHWKTAAGLWGGSLLIRSSLIFATPLLLLLMPRKHALRFVVIVALLITPYAVRNWFVLHTLAPFGTNGGENLRVGHNEIAYTTGGFVDLKTLPDWSEYAGLDEVAQDKALRHAGVTYAVNHRQQLPLATFKKVNQALGPIGWAALLLWGVVWGAERRRDARQIKRVDASAVGGRGVERRGIFRA